MIRVRTTVRVRGRDRRRDEGRVSVAVVDRARLRPGAASEGLDAALVVGGEQLESGALQRRVPRRGGRVPRRVPRRALAGPRRCCSVRVWRRASRLRQLCLGWCLGNLTHPLPRLCDTRLTVRTRVSCLHSAKRGAANGEGRILFLFLLVNETGKIYTTRQLKIRNKTKTRHALSSFATAACRRFVK